MGKIFFLKLESSTSDILLFFNCQIHKRAMFAVVLGLISLLLYCPPAHYIGHLATAVVVISSNVPAICVSRERESTAERKFKILLLEEA